MSISHEQPNMEKYTPEVVRRILQSWEHIKGISESTSFLVLHGSVRDAFADLHILYLDVREAFRKLPLRQRKALFLTLIADEPELDVAIRFGIPRSTLHARIQEALKNLSASLNERSHPLNHRGSLASFDRLHHCTDIRREEAIQ